MDALSQKGCKKALDLDDFCIVGIHYVIAWRWRGLDSKHLIYIYWFVKIEEVYIMLEC